MIDSANEKYKFHLLTVLSKFEELCEKYDLQYFASSGTAIGAVRHKGIIPWDDDIDVYMLRPDYDRLVSLRNVLDGSGYKIAALGDEGYIYPFAKMYDSNTTLIEYEWMPECRIGVYIDIFPLDEVSGSFKSISRKKRTYDFLLKLFRCTYRKAIFDNSFSMIKQGMYASFVVSYFPKSLKNLIRKSFIRYDRNWSCERGDSLMTHSCIYKLEKEIYPKEWFSEFEDVQFEDGSIRVCRDVDKYLTKLFGDYMTPPPIEARKPLHEHFYLNLCESLTCEQVYERVNKGEHFVG